MFCRFAPAWRFTTSGVPLFILLLAASCGDPPLGQGVGLPAFEERRDAPAPDLHLVRAFVPTDGTSTGFVELRNDTASVVDLGMAPVLLQSSSGSTELATGLWPSGQTQVVSGAAFEALNIHPHAGELAVFDANLRLASYGAWGNDPAEWGSGLLGLAQAAGVSTIVRPVPFPLAPAQAILLDASRPEGTCADSNLLASSPVSSFACTTAGASPPLALSRVTPAGIDPSGSAVELINLSGIPIDIFGVRLCVGTAGCLPLMPEDHQVSSLLPASTDPATGAVDPGRKRVAMMDGQAVSSTDWTTSLAPLRSHDVLALAPPGLVQSPAWNVVALGTPQGSWPLSTDVVPAALRDLWLAQPRPAPRLAQESLALMTHQPQSPSQPSAWRLSALPFGTALRDANAPYDACSAPQSPAAAGLTFDSIVPWDRDGSVMVAIGSASAAPIVMSKLVLAAGTQQSALPENTAPLVAGQQLFVLVKPTPCLAGQDAGDVCLQLPQPLAAGELSILDAGIPSVHMQWGASSAASVWGAAAVARGLWPADTCRIEGVPDFALSRQLVRVAETLGQSPPDFYAAHLMPHQNF